MPIGIIIASLSIVAGGLIGSRLGSRLSEELKEKLNMVFGVCSMSMGISNIVLMQNMPAVVLSIVLGTVIGVLVRLGRGIEAAGIRLQRLLPGGGHSSPENTALLVTAVVLFCSSGTGIYGSMISGMTGDHSILITKACLDLLTSMIFACSLGAVVSLIAAPQFVIFMALFLAARAIFPLTTPTMIGDFKACGGFIMLATGFRLMRVKQCPVADMIPAMVLVMPISALWTGVVLPLLG